MMKKWMYLATAFLLACSMFTTSAFAAETIVSGDTQITIYSKDETPPEADAVSQGPVYQYDYTIYDTHGNVKEQGTTPDRRERDSSYNIVLENGESVTFTPAGDSRGFLISRGTQYKMVFRVSPKARMLFRAEYTEPVPSILLDKTTETTAFIQWGTAEESGYVQLYAQNLSSDTVTLTEITFDY